MDWGVPPTFATVASGPPREGVGRASQIGASLGPTPPHAKARLQREFGLYPRGSSVPVGPAHYEGVETRFIGMMYAEASVRSQGSVGEERERVVSPFLAGIASRMERPKFSGRDSDWKDFVRNWNRYLAMVRQCSGGVVDEVLLFEMLRDSLDVASQNRLQARREGDPSLTYERFLARVG